MARLYTLIWARIAQFWLGSLGQQTLVELCIKILPRSSQEAAAGQPSDKGLSALAPADMLRPSILACSRHTMSQHAQFNRMAHQRSCSSTPSTSYNATSCIGVRSAAVKSLRPTARISAEVPASVFLGTLLQALAQPPRLRARGRRVAASCSSAADCRYDVLGLAQAMVDFGATVPDDFLAEFAVEKGGRR